MKKRKVHKADVAMDMLYRAVSDYLESVGGKAVVVGGIEVMTWPHESEFKFKLCIGVLGKKPGREASRNEL